MDAIEEDEQQDSGKKYEYSNGFGSGYGSSIAPGEAHVHVIRGDWEYVVTIYHVAGANPDQCRKLAEDMVVDIEKNLAKKGPSSNNSAPAPTLSSEGADWLSGRLG